MSLNSYSFDADQRLTDETQVGQSGGNGVAPKQIEFGYNALGQFTSIARYDFVGIGPMTDIATEAVSYDAANRMTNLAYTGQGGGVSIDAFSFALDNADRITSRTSTVDGTVNYGYDVTNQVTSAHYTGTGQPPNEAYSYTKNGNRTNTGYSTGTNNQLLSDGTFNYSCDGEGNRTVRTRISNAQAADYRTTYSWDYRNRLTDVEYFNNSGVLTKHVHYVYDTLDHEIGKQIDDTGGGIYDRAEWYSLDISPDVPLANVPSTKLADPLLQFDPSGNLQYRYLNGPTPAGVDAVMGEEAITTPGQAGTDYWPLGDQVNTPHETVNNASAVVDHVITNTFGVVTSESNTAIHHWAGFGGGHNDPDTGLVVDYHRFYDPATGRWTNEDPMSFRAGDPNLSRYAHNDVPGLADPTGLFAPPNPTFTPAIPIIQLPPGPPPLPIGYVYVVSVQYVNGGILYGLSNGYQYFQPYYVIANPQPTVTVPVFNSPTGQFQYNTYPVPQQSSGWTWGFVPWGGTQGIPGFSVDPTTGFGGAIQLRPPR